MRGTNAEGQPFPHQAEIIEPDMSLKYRVGGRPGIAGCIRREAIEKAERAILALSKDYINVARGQIAEIMARFNYVRDDIAKQANINPPITGEGVASYLMEIAMIAREIKGQARSCGYDLLTEVAESLYGFVAVRRQVNARQIAFIEAHIDVLQHIVTYDLRGNGGDISRELLNTIVIARRKLEQK